MNRPRVRQCLCGTKKDDIPESYKQIPGTLYVNYNGIYVVTTEEWVNWLQGKNNTMPKENKSMSIDEFTRKAKEIYNKHKGYAGEEGHIDRDDLMEECLRSLGYEKGLNILNSMKAYWYS